MFAKHKGNPSRRPHVMSAARRWRKPVALLGAAAVVLTGSGLGMAPAPDAAAAGPENPWTTLTVTKTADGTGHGTSSGTFINSQNGFDPADDTPTDGVVSSGDIVSYLAEVEFKASSARRVSFTINAGEYLAWDAAGDVFCQNGHFVRASRSGNTCTFEVPAGAVEQFTAPIVLTGKDTGGRAIPNQTLSIGVGVNGVHTTAKAADVTVVSAPTADVYVTAQQTYEQSRYQSMRSVEWSQDAQSGFFWATPRPLFYPGFSPTKGASTGGQWWGEFDVSSFPEGTTWRVGGAAAPVTDGKLVIPRSQGAVRIDYTVPAWPAQSPLSDVECTDPAMQIGPNDEASVNEGCWGPNETHDFPVRVIVAPGSFEAEGGMPNNGGDGDNIGWQPGDGKNPDFDTRDVSRGSLSGQPYRNNDWTAARVVRSWDPPLPTGDLPIARKEIYGPYDGTKTLWEQENLSEEHGADIRVRSCQQTSCPGVAPETEVQASLYTTTGDHIWNGTGEPVVLDYLLFADRWDVREQYFDATRAPVFNDALNAVGDRGGDIWQWTDKTDVTEAQMADMEDEGWYDGLPNAAQAQVATAVRVLVPATEAGTYQPHTRYEVRLPLVVRSTGELAQYAEEKGLPGPEKAYDGRAVSNLTVLRAEDSTAGASARTTYPRYTIVRLPRPAEVAIAHTAKASESGSDGYVPVGSSVEFTVTPSVKYVASTSTGYVHPVITLDLDKCFTNFKHTSGPSWNVEVKPAVPGPSGRVCGDDESTPAQMIFTPASQDGRSPISWTNRLNGIGELPKITYTATPALTTLNGASLGNGATIEADEELDDIHNKASADVNITVIAREANAAKFNADFKKVEINEPLSWTWNLYSTSETLAMGENSTVLILPYVGDGEIYDAAIAGELYDGVGYDALGRAKASDFQGTYTLADVRFSLDDTSPRASLWYTTDPIVDPVPGATSNWFPVDGASAEDLRNARAIKVLMDAAESPETSTAQVHVTLEPRDNARDDVYVMWPGKTALTDGGSGADADRQVPPPYPDDIRVVASTISGTVWWDPNKNGRIDDSEKRIPDAKVTLHAENGTLLATTSTDDAGYYEFDGLHSGKYYTVVHRGTQIPKSVTTYYSRQMNVDQTYSFNRQYMANAKEQSTQIALGLDAHHPRVDFGFYQPNPGIMLDKSEADVECDSGICTVSWDVTISNSGADDLNDVEWYDKLSNDAISVDVRGGEWKDQEFIPNESLIEPFSVDVGSDTTTRGYRIGHMKGNPSSNPGGQQNVEFNHVGNGLAIDANGGLWTWGINTNGKLGTGKPVYSGGARAEDVYAPEKVKLPAPVVKAVGAHRTFALDANGDMWAWGYDGSQSQNTPVQILDDWCVEDLWGASTYVVVKTCSGEFYGTGYAQYLLGAPYQSSYIYDFRKLDVPANTVKFGIASEFVYMLTDNGDLYAVGNNSSCQLGTGNRTNATSPVKIASGMMDVVAASAYVGGVGTPVSYALDQNGKLWGWGSNRVDSILPGATGSCPNVTGTHFITTPRAIDHHLTFTSLLGTHGAGVMALDEFGGLWVNGRPNLAFGLSSETSSIAVGMTHILKDYIFTGGRPHVGLLQDGTILSWGRDSWGSLGRGCTSNADCDAVKPPAVLPLMENAPHRPDGDSFTYRVTATYLQPSHSAGEKVVVNQAWVDSPLTPYEGLHGQPEPDPAEIPAADGMDPRGVPGNGTCNTDATSQRPEDSCDQVPGKLPASPNEVGALAGVAWVDTARDGVRADDEPLLPGVKVLLTRDGVVFGESVTDESGAFLFEGLPPGDGYTVQFGISHLDAGDGTTYAFVAQDQGGDDTVDSDADPITGLTGGYTVVANQTTRHVDAGVEVYGPAISLVKSSDRGDDLTMEVPKGESSDPLTVYFTFTNVGDEPLTEIEWTDETIEGPEIEGFVCDPSIEGLVLAPGDSVTCTGTLPGMSADDTHTDSVTVTARGQSTKKIVTDDDPFTVKVKEKWVPPVIGLPDIGGYWNLLALLAAILAALLLARAAHRAWQQRTAAREGGQGAPPHPDGQYPGQPGDPAPDGGSAW